MFSQFFGNYLVSNNLITEQHLNEAIAIQDSVHVKLGVLAVENGYLTADQAISIHEIQTKKDSRFGEIAIEEGYLTREQVDKLLKDQTKQHLLLSQALIDKKFFTLEQLEKALSDFRTKSGLNDEEFEALKNYDIEKIAVAFFKPEEEPDAFIYNEYFSLFIRNVVRFIDDNIGLKKAIRVDSYSFEWFCYQSMSGDKFLCTGFGGTEQGLAEIGSRFAEDVFPKMTKSAYSAIYEFLNCINTLFISKMRQSGVNLGLLPAGIQTGGTLMNQKSIYKIPFFLPFGNFDFIITDGIPSFKI